ncbi:pyridoxine biosynthesis protein [Starmerella bacillaris]|uniref:pyridoxal 5'-phosphate synthase (glutamine hydrolyzing) n=1 Tax=Starmerella bacillaris TaxID=1247836 RepID=A0AAV5RDU4_STABA|nr:pyridoxine biosynthesis protein [Starmerella bacillaris]
MSQENKSDFKVKVGLAQMLKGGVIMDVSNPEQAKIAEEAGACAVMALERIPAEMRASGRVCRMSDPEMIKSIMDTVTIPVMAKVRIGHIVEAQVIEALKIDYIDESEVLTNADNQHHIDKTKYAVPFVCGAKNIGEALRRIAEGAAMIRTKGEAGTGDISEAVKHINEIQSQIRSIKNDYNNASSDQERRLVLGKAAAAHSVDVDLLKTTVELGRLPVVNFGAGGVATPADAALLMQLGCDGVFVGSGIFKSENPLKLAKAIVGATTHYSDPVEVLKYSTGLGELMPGVIVNPRN